MRFHDRVVIVDLAATLSQITDQFLAAIQLRARRLVAIKIADQTNPERDVVEIIAVHMAAVDLPAPAVAHFDLTVPGRCPVANNKMVGEPVLHPSHAAMVIIECRGVALSCPAIVHDDELPPPLHDRGAVDLGADGARKITITAAAAASSRSKKPGKETAWLFITGFFDRNLRRLFFDGRHGGQRSRHDHRSRQQRGRTLSWRGL